MHVIDGWSTKKKKHSTGALDAVESDPGEIEFKTQKKLYALLDKTAAEEQAQYQNTQKGFSGGQRGGFGGAHAPKTQETDTTLGGKVIRILNAGSGKFFSDVGQFGSKLVGGLEELEGYLNGGWTSDGEYVKGDSPLTSSLLGWVHDGADAVTAQANAELERSANNWSGSRAGQIFNDVAVNGVAAIPQAVLAFGTGGASTAGQLGAQMGTVETALRSLVSDPRFWLSYGQNAGESYAKAKAAGASSSDALTASTFSGLTNAMIDLGGGYENSAWMNDRSLTGGQIVKNLGKRVLEQSGEEYAKGVAGRLAEKSYSPDKQWYSEKDENAVFNPKRDAKQFARDAATAALVEASGYAAKRLIDGWNGSRGKQREEDRPLTEEEFDTYFARGYNETEDYEEWERYAQTLGKEAPESFQEFQKIKYDAPDTYANLEGFYQYKCDVPEATREDFAAYNALNELDLRGTVRVPPEAVSVETLVFHDDHASHHGCTLDDAKSYVQNAFCTVRRTRWDGESINYYSAKGAVYIDAATGEIKTSFPRQKFDPLTKSIVEVFR